jgi:membrane protein
MCSWTHARKGWRRYELPDIAGTSVASGSIVASVLAQRKKGQPRGIRPLLVQTFQEWKGDKAARLAAALSFYTALSIAPLLVVSIAVAGLVLGPEAARGEILNELQGMIGADSARTVDSMIEAANKPRSGIVATVIGIVILLFGASGVFAELQGALNTIWEVEPKPGRGFWSVVRERFLSFTMVIVLAFLLLVALVLNSALSMIGNFVQGMLPGGAILWQVITLIASFAVATSTFVLIFKFVPDVEIGWRDVWVGALVTAVLFTLGKFLIGVYMGRAAVASTYGAAGSVMVFLLWVYYSSQILFFGAELTQVYASMYGSRIVASKNAQPIDEPPAGVRMALPRS